MRVDVYAVTRFFSPFRTTEVGVQTRISDISEGGAKLVTFEEGIPVETEIFVSFILPGGKEEQTTFKAVVRYTILAERNLYSSQNLYQSGVEFTELKGKSKRAIQEYVRRKQKKEKDEAK